MAEIETDISMAEIETAVLLDRAKGRRQGRHETAFLKARPQWEVKVAADRTPLPPTAQPYDSIRAHPLLATKLREFEARVMDHGASWVLFGREPVGTERYLLDLPKPYLD